MTWPDESARHSLASKGLRTVSDNRFKPSSVGSFRNRRVNPIKGLEPKITEQDIRNEDWLNPDSVFVKNDFGQFIVDFAPHGMFQLSSIIVEGDRIYGTLRLPKETEGLNEVLGDLFEEKYGFDKIKVYRGGESNRPHVQFVKMAEYSKARHYYEIIESIVDDYGEVLTSWEGWHE